MASVDDGRRPAAGSRPVSAFDRQMMSGVTDACSQANIRPGAAEPGEHFVGDHQHVRSDRRAARTPARNSAGHTIMPPAPCSIGSTSTAATDPPSCSSRASVSLEARPGTRSGTSPAPDRADSGSNRARARGDVEQQRRERPREDRVVARPTSRRPCRRDTRGASVTNAVRRGSPAIASSTARASFTATSTAVDPLSE